MSTAPDESGSASSRDLSALSLLDLIANQDMPLEPIHRYEQDEREHEREDLSGPDAPLSYAAQALQLQVRYHQKKTRMTALAPRHNHPQQLKQVDASCLVPCLPGSHAVHAVLPAFTVI